MDDKKPKIKAILYESIANKAFYGECNPVYLEGGNHIDPVCAFSCLAQCYPSITGVSTALENAEKDVKNLLLNEMSSKKFD